MMSTGVATHTPRSSPRETLTLTEDARSVASASCQAGRRKGEERLSLSLCVCG